MQMYQAGQPSNLTPQDLQNYFGWPPPPLIIYNLSESPQKKQRILLIVLTLVAAFFLCGIFSSISGSGLVIAIATVITIVMIVKKTPIPPPVLPTVPPPPPGPTDEEYEDWVKSHRSSIHRLGIQKLGLDVKDIQVSQPLYIRSIIWPNSNDARFYQSRGSPVCIKRDMYDRPHGSINRFTFFYPTQHSIEVFICDVNALETARFENKKTYYYDDIVGIETKSFNLNDGNDHYVMQHFELQVSNGRSIEATTYVHDLDVDQTVNALRTLLRDKKYGTQGGGFGYTSP